MIRKSGFLLLLISLSTLVRAQPPAEKKPLLKTIIIDPGHGGKDQGAPGLVSTEAQVCLEIGMKLGKELEQQIPGVKILYTRTSDILPGNKPTKGEALRYRASFANQSGADLFIAIHCNAAGKRPGGWYEKRIVGYDTKTSVVGKGRKKHKVTQKIPIYENFYHVNEAKGTETYLWAARETDDKVNNLIGEFSSASDSSSVEAPENDPVILALKNIYLKKYFRSSLELANYVQAEFEKAGRINRGVKQRNNEGIWVLHATGMPSILIETGFITNKEEEEYLNSNAGQQEIVSNIAASVNNYIEYLDKKRKGLIPADTKPADPPKKSF
jgi:N-acetylmuramoyl-L-alanine amidase